MEIQIISIIIGIIIGIIICCIDYYRTVNKVRKIYKSWNVGDHVARKVDDEFRASWAVVIKKHIDIPFDLNHIDEIKLWYKSKE